MSVPTQSVIPTAKCHLKLAACTKTWARSPLAGPQKAGPAANLDGIEAQPINTGEKFYLGLSVSHLDKRVAIPLMSPERETLLEYDLTRAISQVSKPAKPVLGIMTAFPMFGSPGMQMMNQPPQPTWAVVSELQRGYEVREVSMASTRIDDEVKVLMVVHPRGISAAGQYAIDQFVLRGGKLIAFLDTYAYFDQMKNPVNPQQQMGGGASNLDKLFTAWGHYARSQQGGRRHSIYA